jgi:hypothetical protein
MKNHFVFIVFLLLFGCEKSSEPISDPTSQIKGIIVSSSNREYLDSVLVGFVDSSFIDSLILFADSHSFDELIGKYSQFAAPITYTIKGRFHFDFAYASKPPVNYEQMFAYKKGRKLWKYNSESNTVYHLISNTDSIKIEMQFK